MGDVEDKLTQAASLVPEVYYDLIARIPAGLTLFLGGLLVTGVLESQAWSLETFRTFNWAPSAGLLALVLAASYVLGILVTPWGYPVRERYYHATWVRLLPDYADLLAKHQGKFGMAIPLQDLQTGNVTDRLLRRLYGGMHDYLKGSNSQANLILPKMTGEASLCEHLVPVSLALAGALIGSCLLRYGWAALNPNLLLGVLSWLALGAASFRAGQFRYERLLRRHFDFLALSKVGQ